jgi:uncharacterized protein
MAQGGDVDAQRKIGDVFLQGAEGIPENYQLAWHWYMAASEQGDFGAGAKLLLLHWTACSGFHYHVPTFGDGDYKKLAARVFLAADRAVDDGDWDLAATLGYIQLHEKVTPERLNRVAANLLNGALAGDADCMVAMAFFSDRLGLTVPNNPKTYLQWNELAAQNGNNEAHFVLGQAYLRGRGVPEATTKGLHHLRIAANLGCSDAALEIALCFELGNGVEKDLVQSVEWFRRAALGECPPALYALAIHKDRFPNSIVDQQEADRCLREASRRGHPAAMMKQAALLLRPPATTKIFEAGVNLVEMVLSRQGYVDTEFVLGHIYHHGVGVSKDHTKAAAYWRLSANAGVARAQVSYGRLLFRGDGVTENMELAEHYFEMALAQGHRGGAIGIGFVAHFLHGDNIKASAYLTFGATDKEHDAAHLCRSIVSRFNEEELEQARVIGDRLQARFSN